MVRPDGTGEPSQQELDQAFPPQQQRSHRGGNAYRRSATQRQIQLPRPMRRSRGPTRRSAAFASLRPGP